MTPMLTFKRLNECRLDEAVQIWNESFAGYFFDMTMTVDAFISRLVLEELSSSLSFVAYQDDRPAGILLNGIRSIQGNKVAWNGGTGVIEAFRGTGVSRALVEHALLMYREQSVQLATLEAIGENEKANRLYKGQGYETVDRIVYWSHGDVLSSLSEADGATYAYEHGAPQDVSEYAFLIPWQSQWANFRRDGETVLVREDGRAIAYALFKRTVDADGRNNGVTVGQVRVLEERGDRDQLIRFLLAKTLRPERTSYKRTVPALASDVHLVRALRQLGFKQTLSQVWMTRSM